MQVFKGHHRSAGKVRLLGDVTEPDGVARFPPWSQAIHLRTETANVGYKLKARILMTVSSPEGRASQDSMELVHHPERTSRESESSTDGEREYCRPPPERPNASESTPRP